jgi:hypothetical protein
MEKVVPGGGGGFQEEVNAPASLRACPAGATKGGRGPLSVTAGRGVKRIASESHF